MPRWDAWLGGIADVLGPLLMQTPPRLGSPRLADLRGTLRLAWRYRGLGVRTVADVTRLLVMSITDLLDDWFESEQVKASLAISEAPTPAAGGHPRPSGGPPVDQGADLGAVADAVARLSVLAADLGDLLDALDVNPLVAGPAGCAAVDAPVLPAGPGRARPPVTVSSAARS
jgi:hypothetical protein